MRIAPVVFAAITLTAGHAAGRGSSSEALPATEQAPRPLGITNVTVIDVERGARLRDHTVIIEAGRISTVGPSSQVRVPDGYGVIQARGKFVIPGFVDPHAHLTMVASGFAVVERSAVRLSRFALFGASTMVELTSAVVEGVPALQREVDRPPIPRVYIEPDAGRTRGVVAETTGQAPDGAVIHEELRRTVDAGVAPAAALRALTVDAARALGWHDRVGSVSPGRFADLLILDANPLEDIRNTTRINAIVIGGRFIDSAERQRLLAWLAQK